MILAMLLSQPSRSIISEVRSRLWQLWSCGCSDWEVVWLWPPLSELVWISYLLWFLDSLQNPLQSFRKFAVDWDEFSEYFGSQLWSWSCWFLVTKELFSALASKAAWLKGFSMQDLCKGMRHNPASGMWGWTLHFELEMRVSPLHVEFGTQVWPRRLVFLHRGSTFWLKTWKWLPCIFD